MCHTQLAHAVLTALAAKGRYTTEVTSGTTGLDDNSIYASQLLQQDDPTLSFVASLEETEFWHRQALSDFQACGMIAVAGMLLIMTAALFGRGWSVRQTFLVFPLATVVAFLGYWNMFLGPLSVADCVKQAKTSQDL